MEGHGPGALSVTGMGATFGGVFVSLRIRFGCGSSDRSGGVRARFEPTEEPPTLIHD